MQQCVVSSRIALTAFAAALGAHVVGLGQERFMFADGMPLRRSGSEPMTRRARSVLSTTPTRPLSTGHGIGQKIVRDYEHRLRENASLPKVFKYFASQLDTNGRECMTPHDFVRSITPGVPPDPHAKPINVPLVGALGRPPSIAELRTTLADGPPCPAFFKFSAQEDETGLISYGRFLILLTLLTIPQSELRTAYLMSSGKHFKQAALRGKGLGIANFDWIMQQNFATRGQGYDSGDEHHHSRRSIVRSPELFGPALDKRLSFQEFERFVNRLRTEVLRLEYELLSDIVNRDGTKEMSLIAFASSIVALAPSSVRDDLECRARALAAKEVPVAVAKAEMRAHVRAGTVLAARRAAGGRYSSFSGGRQEVECASVTESAAEYKPRAIHPGELEVEDLRVSFEQYAAWRAVLSHLPQMQHAVRKYSNAGGNFTYTNLARSAFAVAGVELSKAQVWAVFEIFSNDGGEEGVLQPEEFVRYMMRGGMLCRAANPTEQAEGLDLDELAQCFVQSCAECASTWWLGRPTIDLDPEDFG